jgi:hypothetical protein
VRARWCPTVAAALALALLLGSCEAADPPRSPRPAVTESGFAALWPEQTLEAAVATQAAVDAGDPGLAWRTDAGGTARRFVTDVLGWDGFDVVRRETWRLGSGLEIARVWLCDPGGCPSAGAAYDEEVVLKRLAADRPDGVWSVTDVTSGRLQLEQAPDIRIRDPHLHAGRRLSAIAVEGGLPDGTRVVAGSATLGPCGAMTTTTATMRFSRVRFQVGASLDAGCAKAARPAQTPGYVFVFPALRGTSTAPETLFTRGRPREGPPILDLSAMAVRFLPRVDMPKPPPSWRSRDPETLPECRTEHLALAISAGRAVPGFGVGVFTALRKETGPPCHAAPNLRLSLFDATGDRIRVAGPHEQTVEGYLPGYVPGTRSLYVAWGLFEWCGTDRAGPIVVTVRSDGLVARTVSEQLVRWCVPAAGPARVEVVPLDPTP